MVKRYSRKPSKRKYKVSKRTRKNTRKRSKKKNTRKLRGGAKKVDITNEIQISNLDPNTINKDIDDEGITNPYLDPNTINKDIDDEGITNPLGESVDELSESDEMYPPDPDIQFEKDKMYAELLNLLDQVQTPEVKQKIKKLENALKERIEIEDKIISISRIESPGKKYYNTTNFSIHKILINISGKLTEIFDIRPTDRSKYCEELINIQEMLDMIKDEHLKRSNDTKDVNLLPDKEYLELLKIDLKKEKNDLTEMWNDSRFAEINFFGMYLTGKIFFTNVQALGKSDHPSLTHNPYHVLIMTYDYATNVCNFSNDPIGFKLDVNYSGTLKKLFEFKVDQRVIVDTTFIFKNGKHTWAHSTLLISEHFPDPDTGIYKKKLIFFNPDSKNHKKYNEFCFFISKYYMDNFGLPQGESQIPYEWVFSNRISSVYRFSIQEGRSCFLYSSKLWLLLILNPEIRAEILIEYLFSQSSNIMKQLIQTAYSSLYFIELFYKHVEKFIKDMETKMEEEERKNEIMNKKYKEVLSNQKVPLDIKRKYIDIIERRRLRMNTKKDQLKLYSKNNNEPSKAYKNISDYLDINGCPKLSLSGSVPVKLKYWKNLKNI